MPELPGWSESAARPGSDTYVGQINRSRAARHGAYYRSAARAAFHERPFRCRQIGRSGLWWCAQSPRVGRRRSL